MEHFSMKQKDDTKIKAVFHCFYYLPKNSFSNSSSLKILIPNF